MLFRRGFFFRTGNADKRRASIPRSNIFNNTVSQFTMCFVIDIVFNTCIIIVAVDRVGLAKREVGVLRRSKHAAGDCYERDGQKHRNKFFHFSLLPFLSSQVSYAVSLRVFIITHGNADVNR